MSGLGPISSEEMAGHVRDYVDQGLPGLAGAVQGNAFEVMAPATGQRFRVTVEEIPGWSDQMDRELAAMTEQAAARVSAFSGASGIGQLDPQGWNFTAPVTELGPRKAATA